MEQNNTWGKMDERNSTFVGSLSLDISCMLEGNHSAPPVMFKTRELLKDWAKSHELTLKKIGTSRLSSAIRVQGFFRGIDGYKFWYDQVWARGTYKNFAKLLPTVAIESYKMNREDLAGLDADHVINRSRIKDFPTAWVVIFPVPASANRAFGGRVERYLACPDSNTERIDLPPLVALKLLCGELPRTTQELRQAMETNIHGRIIRNNSFVQDYCAQMEKEATTYMGGNLGQ